MDSRRRAGVRAVAHPVDMSPRSSGSIVWVPCGMRPKL
jgi:hypothetical protein